MSIGVSIKRYAGTTFYGASEEERQRAQTVQTVLVDSMSNVCLTLRA